MAEKKVNYDNTEVEANVSQADIIKELSLIGFNETGQHTKDGVTTIMAAYNSVNFLFKTDVPKVITEMINRKSENQQRHMRVKDESGLKLMQKIQEQAVKTAWRTTYHYVKAVCACINIGAIEIGHAFAGHLAIYNEQQELVTMGTVMTAEIALGRIAPTEVFNKFAIEDKSNDIS